MLFGTFFITINLGLKYSKSVLACYLGSRCVWFFQLLTNVSNLSHHKSDNLFKSANVGYKRSIFSLEL
jgi:hypothetical protein